MKSDEDTANEIPVISFDHMGSKSRAVQPEKIGSSHILLGSDRTSIWVFAPMVHKKGIDLHAIKVLDNEIRLVGYNRMASSLIRNHLFLHSSQQLKDNELQKQSDGLLKNPRRRAPVGRGGLGSEWTIIYCLGSSTMQGS